MRPITAACEHERLIPRQGSRQLLGRIGNYPQDIYGPHPRNQLDPTLPSDHRIDPRRVASRRHQALQVPI